MTKLITHNELARFTLSELKGLFRKIFNELAQSDPGTPQRRNSLASLENIQREINQRYSRQWNP